MRERLPAKRGGWHLKANIGGQTYYLSAGEYPDGRLGEVWIHAHQEGSFSQGMATALARTMSIALQNGVSVEEVVRSLRHLDFPPRGIVIGSAAVRRCTSVVDWIAQEMEAAYVRPPGPAEPGPTPGPAPFDGTYPLPAERAARFTEPPPPGGT